MPRRASSTLPLEQRTVVQLHPRIERRLLSYAAAGATALLTMAQTAEVAKFLEETELTKKPKTLAAYTTALNYFTESCP
jgi:hypothetical protein